MIALHHGRVELALHELREGSGRPLLLLHGLGEYSPETVPEHAAAWPGPVVALDFTGHGASTVPVGGGYTGELLMADVDIALAHLGPSTIRGRGLGAYIAVLAAGGRPELVRGAVLADGPGLWGGGPGQSSPLVVEAGPPQTPDPWALIELATDIRPPEYVLTYARHAAERSGLDHPLAVAATARPPWLAAVVEHLALRPMSVTDALTLMARTP